jgi:hypothetical protein
MRAFLDGNMHCVKIDENKCCGVASEGRQAQRGSAAHAALYAFL